MKSIILIRPKAYAILTCANCRTAQEYRAADKVTNKPRDASLYMVRKWAAEDGWTKNTRGQYICRACSARRAATSA